MKGLYSMFLALAALVAVSESKTVLIQAGPGGSLTFSPNVTDVSPGDKVVYSTNSTHSVYQSDAAKSCSPSAKTNAFKGQITPNTADGLTWTISPNATVGSKLWYYCNVPGHCAAGMTGTLNVVAGNSTGNSTDTTGGSDNSTDTSSGSGSSGSSTSPSGGSSGTSTSGSSSSTSTTKSAANIQAVNTLVLVFGLLSSSLYLSF